MDYAVRLATASEMDEVGRLRYTVYVERMGRQEAHACHRTRSVREPLDETGAVLGAFDESGRLVGTARVNLGVPDFYRDLYRLDPVGLDSAPEGSVSFTTKMILHPEVRGGTLARDLSVACFQWYAQHGVLLNFVDCNRPVDRLFMRMGFIDYCGTVEHPAYGEVHPLALLLPSPEVPGGRSSPFSPDARRYYTAVQAGQACDLLEQLTEPSGVRRLVAVSGRD